MTNSINAVALAYLEMLQPVEDFLTQDEFEALTEEDQIEYEELLYELSPAIIKRVIKARQTQRDAVGLKGKEAEYVPSSRNTKRQKLDHKYRSKEWSARKHLRSRKGPKAAGGPELEARANKLLDKASRVRALQNETLPPDGEQMNEISSALLKRASRKAIQHGNEYHSAEGRAANSDHFSRERTYFQAKIASGNRAYRFNAHKRIKQELHAKKVQRSTSADLKARAKKYAPKYKKLAKEEVELHELSPGILNRAGDARRKQASQHTQEIKRIKNHEPWRRLDDRETPLQKLHAKARFVLKKKGDALKKYADTKGK